MPELRPDAAPTLLPAPDALAATQVRPAPRTASGSGFDEEIRVLLRARLLIIAGAGIAISAAMLLGAAAGDAAVAKLASHPAAEIGLLVTGLVVSAATLGRLRSAPTISLSGLRRLELAIFGAIAAVSGVARYYAMIDLPGESADPRYAQLAVERATAVSNIPWMIIIVFYGVLIPNTRRRGVRMVLSLAAVPFAATLAAAVANPALRPFVGFVLTVTAFGVFLVGVAAVFGASRIITLQRQAFEAQRRANELGPYTLTRKLGAGGMGEVWLAEHRLLKRPCAMKFVRAELACEPATAARFEREVRAVTTLTHFNTVRIYDYGRSDDGSFYYVMEYLEGPTLDALVKENGPLAPGRAVHLLRQLCGALGEAHARGMVHRDLKPSNVIVATLGGQKDVAKLLDFGLVQDLSTADGEGRLTQAGVVMGTPAYMCPEQASGSARVDARGDVYALGAVAFFVLTGRPPFERDTVGGYIAAHLTEPAPDVRTVRAAVPAELAEVVARCLRKDPAERFQSASELDAALAASVATFHEPTAPT